MTRHSDPPPGSRPPGRPPGPNRAAARQLLACLEQAHPDAGIALHFTSPFELLIATILSAQCTDRRVNLVTAELFRRYRSAAELAAAAPDELEEQIRSTGFFRSKARHIRGCAARIVERFAGAVPRTMAELLTLPGVGRKTANVVLGNGFGIRGMVVDTHVGRVSRRLGWARARSAEGVERELMALFPETDWTRLGHLLIAHGRRFCKAPVPLCTGCPLSAGCPRTGVSRAR